MLSKNYFIKLFIILKVVKCAKKDILNLDKKIQGEEMKKAGIYFVS